MTVQIEFWQLVLLLLSFLGFVFGTGKLFLAQINKGLDERFSTLKEADELRDKARTAEIGRIQSSLNAEAESWRRVEREVLVLQAELPNQYVRRDDWIRFGGSIDSKMDALHQKIDDVKERLK